MGRLKSSPSGKVELKQILLTEEPRIPESELQDLSDTAFSKCPQHHLFTVKNIFSFLVYQRSAHNKQK